MKRILLGSFCYALWGCGGDKADKSQDTEGCQIPVAEPDPFEDINPDPGIFEAHLTAREATLNWNCEPVKMLTYGGQLPGPEIRVTQGDRVIVHLKNDLPEDFPTTIHWHGIEGTNAMDGTPVSQTPIAPGDSFTYDFIVPRSGLFWFHPHVRGSQSVFSGLYGSLIVEDPDKGLLEEKGILPKHILPLVLSDVTLWQNEPVSTQVDNAMEIMNGTEGARLLVNGTEMPSYDLPAGGAVRLQVLNTSITRFYRLRVANHTLFRVGGEGGLLNTVRVEGGTVAATKEDADGNTFESTTVDLRHERGEIVLAPAQRADLVFVPQGQAGDTLTLEWLDFARGRHGMWMEDEVMVMGDAEDDGLRPSIDIAEFHLTEGSGESFSIAEGDPILHAIDREVGQVDTTGTVVDFTGEGRTELQGKMDMWTDSDGVWQMETTMSINDVSWKLQPTGPSQALSGNARTAQIGDTIHWEVYNSTSMAHPWHLHGFSFQPTEFLRNDNAAHEHQNGEELPNGEPHFTRWAVEHDEFLDTILIPPMTSLFYNVHIADPNGDGGSAGRWLKHCHIIQHGEGGMMSELIVEP